MRVLLSSMNLSLQEALMKIAIFSDIHDHIWNLKKALAGVQDAEVLICCGDMCSPFVVDLLVEGFNGRPIHAVAGNNDGDPRRITEKSKRFPNFQYHGEFFQTELGGRLLAVNHYDSLALPIAASSQYDVVCYGHNHRFAIQSGPSLAINPG